MPAQSPIRELAEKLWSGEVSTTSYHPFTPLLALEEVAPQVAFFSGFANAVAIATGEGLVLVDCGSALFAAQLAAHLRTWSDAPLHTAVYTHGHIDHVAGMSLFDDEAASRGRPRPVVVAHEAVPARFARYQRTAGYNTCINTRQFGLPVPWPTTYRQPDRLYRDTLTLEIGGERLDLLHARGETDDHTVVHLPGRRVLLCGDLFIWATPNAGNPQKVQRYPGEWTAALRRLAALDAEVLCPGHGPPIFGAARVRQALADTAALLESLEEQALALLNQGASLDRILHEVKAPAPLLERPYLRPVYDEPEFIVRNVCRLYGGWYDGNPAHLKPAPEAELAAELAALCGGAPRLAERAESLLAAGRLALASHLAELAVQASPGDPALRRTRAAVYRARAASETSLMARNIYLSAAQEP